MISNGRSLTLIGVGFALLLAACGPSSGDGSPTQQAPRTVQVQMTDNLRFEPAEFTFQVGETVRFEVTNSGQIVHEFFVGDEAAQDEFEMDMSGGGMAHDTDSGVSVEPGQTESFDYTFGEPGELLAGCHEIGHYDAGMMATITVEE